MFLIALLILFFPLILGFLFLTPFGWFILGMSGIGLMFWIIGRILSM